ncbi:hypothetical protein FDK38_004862 [Candidozyma auris]|nr:hypothetical protein FDK38_004862 [[Candida] auris]
MKFLVSSDETGNLKEVVCAEGTDTSSKEAIQPELVRSILTQSDYTNVRTRITHMTVVKDILVTARMGGIVNFYSISADESHEYGATLQTYKLNCDEGSNPVSLIHLEALGCLMVALDSAEVFVLSIEGGQTEIPVSLRLPGRSGKNSQPISVFVQNPYEPGIFAYGGKCNDLQVVKLFDKKRMKNGAKIFNSGSRVTPEVVFQAENVEPDHLGLDVPVWITGILFQKNAGKKGFKMVTSTGYGQIRLYDTSLEEEPIGSYKICEKPIRVLQFATDHEDEVIVADSHNFVARVSLFKVDAKAERIVSASAGTFYKPSLKILGKYSKGGNTGAINSIARSPSRNVVATGGLDRYLRVFDVQTRNLLAKVYLGTQISSLLFIEDDGLSNLDRDQAESALEDQNDDEIWEQLDHNAGSDDDLKITKRRRRI